MMKKIILLTCIVSLVLLVSCGKKEKFSYVNEKYEFTFNPPSEWENNYFIVIGEKSDNYIRIKLKSETLSEEAGKDKGPTFISIYVITNEEYEKNKDNDMYDGGPYIKHPSEDTGLWVVYSDPHIKEEDNELYWNMFEALEPENIEKYLYFNDTK